MRHRAAAWLGLALLLAGPALAQQGAPRLPPSVLPGLGSADPRQPVDPRAAPWRSLGRVQLEIGGRCTGVLIGPRLVLTAAHCLVAARSRQLVRPATVHFLLGYHLGEQAGHAQVSALRVGPGFIPAEGGPAASDWALLTLATPLPGALPLALLPEPPAPRTPLVLGGYQQDRPEVILADTACRALGLRRDAAGGSLLLHDCAGTRGSSGAPLLARGPAGEWLVAGVASRTSRDVALGVAVPAGSIERDPR